MHGRVGNSTLDMSLSLPVVDPLNPSRSIIANPGKDVTLNGEPGLAVYRRGKSCSSDDGSVPKMNHPLSQPRCFGSLPVQHPSIGAPCGLCSGAMKVGDIPAWMGGPGYHGSAGGG